MSKNKKIKFNFFSDLLLEQRIMWIVVLLLLCIFCFFAYVQYKAVVHKNGYPIKNITNNNLKDEHCYEDVCVKDVVYTMIKKIYLVYMVLCIIKV